MVITNLERMLRRIIGEDIELVTDLAANLGSVRADQNQVEQVLMNLVVNARDAMPTGGRLLIRTENVELPDPRTALAMDVPPGSYVLVAVQDSGVGMDDDTRSKIFEPFFTTKETGQGTGLGLSTVYGIIKQSGGDIRCDSLPGQGTTFTFVLPRLADEVEAKTKPAGEVIQDSAGHQEHILVVEDEEPVRQLLTNMLRVLNYRTTVAADGEEALALITQEGLRPDLLLTDAIMPKLGGKELVAAIHAILPDLKVILMSGYVDERAGSNDLDLQLPFLQKPFSLNILAAKIREVLGQK
jgi:CheY-like chemotaxis protein